MRVTPSMMAQHALGDMQASLNRLSHLQAQASSGKRILQPDDDPTGTGQVLDLHAQLDASDMHARTIASSTEWMNASDASLTTLTQTVLARAGELATRGANDTLGASERQSLAAEVDQLLSQAMGAANSDLGGRYLFGGTKDTTPPFSAAGNPPVVTYNGNTAGKQREIDNGVTIGVNLTGEDSILNALNTLSGLADDLRNNPSNLSARRAEVESRQDAIVADQAQLGAKLSRLATATDRLAAVRTNLEAARSKVEDADMAETISALTRENTTYQAVLQSNARVLPMSLLDYLH